jgi:hypothetical protein
MTDRVLILRHASGLVNRARRLAIEKWPEARLEVHDLAAYGKPPADFRWDRYAHMLIDDEYLRREGLLWLSDLRSRPNFPKIVRVPAEMPRHKPPAEIEVKAPPLPPKREPRASASSPAAEIRPIRQDSKAATRPEPPVESPSMIQRAEAKRLADAQAVLKSAGIEGFTPVRPLGSGATANVCLCERGPEKQQVVLKILKSEGSGDSDLLARFVQEYFAASSIDSPYVAMVFELGYTQTHA